MKDRYLFRGKKIEDCEFVTGFYTWCEGNSFINVHESRLVDSECNHYENFLIPYEINPETIGQCVGLKDSTGKLAFEGDTWSGFGYDRKGVIEFDEDSYSFQFGLDGNVMDQERSVMESGQFIITGNIHDA